MSKLVSMKVVGFKSLRSTEILFAQEGCTTLVGSNDSGKSSILRSLLLFFRESGAIRGDEHSRGIGAPGYTECVLELTGTEADVLQLSPGKVTFVAPLTGVRKYQVRGIGRQGKKIDMKDVGWQAVSQCFPVVALITPETFTYQVPTRQPQTITQTLISDRFHLANPLAPIFQREAQDRAERERDELVRSIWKSSPRRDFTCIQAAENVTYSIVDHQNRRFPLSDMGDGLQRIVAIALQVDSARTKSEGKDLLILFDEPENSLHPRAQRDLLSFLQSLPRTQVLLATHAPAMIDISRPETIRTVFFDEKKDSTVVLERKHLHDNFETIRFVLGVLPTDALSYGFVNVVVEGAIDFVVYPIWARRLAEAGLADVDLALLRFINGSGSSLPAFFGAALSSGLPTVAILDNDRQGKEYEKKIRDFIRKCNYALTYEPIHFLKSGNQDVDLESVLPAQSLVDAVNAKCEPDQSIGIEDLSANAAVKRSKNIEDFLKRQNVNYDEVKTEISLQVASSMEVEDIPQSVVGFFKALSGLLRRRDELVTRPQV